jgi:hypothetical protein
MLSRLTQLANMGSMLAELEHELERLRDLPSRPARRGDVDDLLREVRAFEVRRLALLQQRSSSDNPPRSEVDRLSRDVDDLKERLRRLRSAP